jgi:hypothetical protein
MEEINVFHGFGQGSEQVIKKSDDVMCVKCLSQISNLSLVSTKRLDVALYICTFGAMCAEQLSTGRHGNNIGRASRFIHSRRCIPRSYSSDCTGDIHHGTILSMESDDVQCSSGLGWFSRCG